MPINPSTGLEDPNYKPATENTGLISAQPLATTTETIAPPAAVTPTQWKADPASTVEGRINSIIQQDSPLMQQAETRGLQRAAKSGLLNSSIAVGAAQGAVLDAAAPIANADASIAARQGEFNAGESNKANMFNTELGVKTQQFNIGEQNKINLEKIRNDNSVLLEQNKGAAQLYDTYQRAINQILNNNTLDITNKDAAIQAQLGMMQSGMAMYASVSGLDLTKLLDFPDGASQVPGGSVPGGGVAGSAASAVQQYTNTADLVAAQRAWDAKRQAIYDAFSDTVGGLAARRYRDSALSALGPRPA